MIEEAYNTNMMLYKELEGLKRALEAYLLTDMPGFKRLANMSSNLDDPYCIPKGTIPSIEETRVAYIQGLEKVARSLGSTARAQHHTVPMSVPPEMKGPMLMLQRLDRLGQRFS
jgi:hypothetical protein